MIRPHKSKQLGSVIVMVTVSLLMLLAMIGMVVDIGWAYFERRAAQVAADAAAEAGARRAFIKGNDPSAPNFCLAPNDTDVLNDAKAYATINGFTDGGEGGRQKVTITSGCAPFPDVTNYPNLDRLHILYWVQARITTRQTSLFTGSAGTGYDFNSGATAVAAVLQVPIQGSVYLLNTNCNPGGTDCSSPLYHNGGWAGGLGGGIDLGLQGTSSSVVTAGAMIVNSSGSSSVQLTGGPTPQVGLLEIAQDGSVQGKVAPSSSGVKFINVPQVPDPTLSMNRGNQPTVPTLQQVVNNTPGQVVYGVPGGFSNTTLTPGAYIGGTYNPSSKLFDISGAPITLTNVTFNSGGKPGTYIFFGGLNLAGNVKLDQGTYIIAGVSNASNPILSLLGSSQLNLTDGVSGPGPGSYRGEMLLLTRPDYTPDGSGSNAVKLLPPAYSPPIQAMTSLFTVQAGVPAVQPSPGTPWAAVANWGFGGISESNSGKGNLSVNITGLENYPACDPGVCESPATNPLNNSNYLYQPAIVWVDRRNTPLANSAINSAGLPWPTPGGSLCPTATFLGPCPTQNTATWDAQGSPPAGFNGMIYMPQGSLMNMQGGGATSQPTLIITGAMSLNGNSTITLVSPKTPALQTLVSLIR
jgi:hypothetical protein